MHTIKMLHLNIITGMASSHLGWVFTMIQTQYSPLWIINDPCPGWERHLFNIWVTHLHGADRIMGDFIIIWSSTTMFLYFHLSFYFLTYPCPQQQVNKYVTAFVLPASMPVTDILSFESGWWKHLALVVLFCKNSMCPCFIFRIAMRSIWSFERTKD